MTTAGLEDQQRLDGGNPASCSPPPTPSRQYQQHQQYQHLNNRLPNGGHHQNTTTTTTIETKTPAAVATNLAIGPAPHATAVQETTNATSVSFHHQDKNHHGQQTQQQQPDTTSVTTATKTKIISTIRGSSTNGDAGDNQHHQQQDSIDKRVTMASAAREPDTYSRPQDDDESSSSEETHVVASAEEYAAKIIKLQQACLIPLKEDLADWLNKILKTSNITTENFMDKLDNGVVICRLAKIISSWCEQQLSTSAISETPSVSTSTTNIHSAKSSKLTDAEDHSEPIASPRNNTNLFSNANGPLRSTTSQSINCLVSSASTSSLNNGAGSAYRLYASNQFLNNLIKMHQTKIWEDAKCRTFYARDNVCSFIKWTKDFGVNQSVVFESDDLVLHANPRQVVLCLLDVARIAYVKYGFTEAPGLVKFEQEIDRPMSSDSRGLKSHNKQSDKQLSEPPENGLKFPGRSRNSMEISADATDELVMRYCRYKEEEAARRQIEELAAIAQVEALEAEEQRQREEQEIASHQALESSIPANADHESSNDTTSMEDKSSVIENSCPPDVADVDSLLPTLEKELESDSRGQDDKSAKVTSTSCDSKPHNTKNLADTGRIDSLDSGEGPTESASTGHSGSRLTSDCPVKDRRSPLDSNQTSIPVPRARTNFLQMSQYPSNQIESSMTNSELSSSRSSLLSNQDERQATSDLDGKVMHIAKSYYGKKATKDVTRLSEGKYKIADRIVFVRLLKGHRVMVRIGGGWDTLENFLFRHKSDPSQVIDPDNLLPLETKMPFDKTPQATPTKTASKLPYYRRSSSASSTNLSLSNLSISNHSLISSTTPTVNRGGRIAPSSSVQSSPTIDRARQQTPYLLINKGRMGPTNGTSVDQQQNRSSQATPNNGTSPNVSHIRRPFYYKKSTTPFSPNKYSHHRPLASSTAPTVSATNLHLYPATLTTRININTIKGKPR